MTAYRDTPVDPSRYRPQKGSSPAASEQDIAAGGRQARLIVRGDGSQAAASIALRCYQTKRRVYAYLRWSEANTTREKYLGDVSDCPDRSTALRVAWQRAQRALHNRPTSLTAAPRTD